MNQGTLAGLTAIFNKTIFWEENIMLKKWKKASALLMVSLASVFALTSCGGGASSGSNTAKKADGKTITVSVDEGYVDYIKSIKDKFEKDNKVKVNVKKAAMLDTLDKLSTDGPTGKAPDVLMAPYDRVGALGSEGQIAEVKLNNDKDYDDTAKKLVTLKGKIYGAPWVIETLVAYYNKDLVPEAPKTFEDLEKLNKDPKFAFPSEAGKGVGFLANWTNFYFGYGLIAGYGGYVFGKNGTDPKDIGIGNNGAVEGLKYVKTWYDMWPKGMQDVKKAGDFIGEQFNKKKAAVIIDGPWAAANYKKAGINYGAAEIPTLPNGKKYQAFAGGKAWVVSNYSKSKAVAQKFIDYLTQTENQKLFYDKTQEVPAGLSGRDYAVSKGNELTKAVINQFKNDQPMPNISEMADVWEPAGNMFFNVASGKKDADKAAAEAMKAVKETLEQKYGNK